MPSVTAEMLSTGRYSDLLIRCKGMEFRVHRAVVCLQSEPLAAVIDGPFKEALTSEIDLDGNEPDIVECMLQFLYTQDYSDGRETVPAVHAATPASSTPKNSKKSKHNLLPLPTLFARETIVKEGDPLTNAKVYIIGDQLQILDLKNHAKKK